MDSGPISATIDEALPEPAPGADLDVAPPFHDFARSIQPQDAARARITAACRMPEEDAVAMLLAASSLPPETTAAADRLARALVTGLRNKPQRGGVEGLIKEYDLSSQEGVALMCLAEALLRIPDRATRDALIRDKVSTGDWRSHLGRSPSAFVNAATWGLLLTGKLTAPGSDSGLGASLAGLIGRGGEPLIRRGVDMAMRMMGERFVTGQTIDEALANSRRLERQGFRYSYDMLGEAALSADDAARYLADYERAIHAIGRASDGRGIHAGPGISIKLSALHPRYCRAQRARVMAELLPRLKALASLTRGYDIGLNIDAEESDRLELSLDLLEALGADPDLAGWNGLGFVVQAYQKRALPVIDWIIAMARRSGRRVMLRLVKGAYWDSEIKRAQQDGLEGFPVFTRKAHTDVSYIACARRLLDAPDAVFPQFATHNARTLASIHAMAGPDFHVGQYEFQCLHGMGEPLYEEVVGPRKLDRPCRIYAPVGTHETLLAYLVRRLLENGANSSFVNRIGDARVAIDDLVADPVRLVAASSPVGAGDPRIAPPRALFGDGRLNAQGLDLASEQRLAALSTSLLASASVAHTAEPPIVASNAEPPGAAALGVCNPADRRDQVGTVRPTQAGTVPALFEQADKGLGLWSATPPERRGQVLVRAAGLLEAQAESLIGLIVRESGKIIADAVGEVREAVDFLRYYAGLIDAGFSDDAHRPLGCVVCISPWNFPLAIFAGQVAAALAAGNAVLAKPAEQTPLIAAAAVRLLHQAGVPEAALQLVPGDGGTGAALVADKAVAGVLFTGSTVVARSIQRRLAQRLNADGLPVPLVAETGGQNAMIVDSSALTEQVVVDVIASAFNSAGQRCSALRLLCLQDEIADRTLAMLRGAMAELRVGLPDRLHTDIGPLIDDDARAAVTAHVAAMRDRGHRVHSLALPDECAFGSFVAPTVIEIAGVGDLGSEVFGPVLHVLRYRRDRLDALLSAIAATGYGLTFGVHTRLDETIAHVTARASAGNLYVNRNIVGAVVGSQPFGGHGLSGTGPKAGGPLSLRRLLSEAPLHSGLPTGGATEASRLLAAHLDAHGEAGLAQRARALAARSPLGVDLPLPGPVGERNSYSLHPAGTVLCRAATDDGLLLQFAALFATGNVALVEEADRHRERLDLLPQSLRRFWRDAGRDREPGPGGPPALALFEGDDDALVDFSIRIAKQDGAIVPIFARSPRALASGRDYPVEFLLRERSLCVNTAAAGGNASLMSMA